MSTTPHAVTDLGKLRWACRRGIKELDVLLTRYVEQRFAAAPLAERQALESLLDLQDPEIYAYCLGQIPVPAHLQSLIRSITAV